MHPSSRAESVVAPASFAQRRMWLLDQLTPGNPAYHVPWLVHLDGPLDRAALDQALTRVVARHEALRTVFAAAEGQPAQLVLPPAPVELAEVTDPAELLTAPFDLGEGPLLRAGLVTDARDRHRLVLVLHHIVADGWSCDVLFDELSRCYAAAVAGTEPELPPLPVQYADFSRRQHDEQRQGALAGSADYWRTQLAGAPTVLALPTDRPRPATQSHRGAWLPVPFDRELGDGVQALARAEGGTPFTVLLAGFAALLARYTAATDFLVGTPVSGRTRPETAGVVGPFANTLALRCRVTPGQTFRELLRAARATTLDALDHQELPFEEVVDLVQPERSLAYNPLVQVLVGLTRRPAAVDRGGLRWRPELVPTETVKMDLHLALEDDGGVLGGRLGYMPGVLDEATARGMAAAYLALLRAAVTDPDVRVDAVPLLPDAERRQMLAASGAAPDRHRPAPVDPGQAVSTQDSSAIAVVGGDGTLSYGELVARADRLAGLLRERGVGPDTPVGVYVERSAALVVALLAIWRAGGVYLPLDPGYPADRLRLMLADSGTRLVLTHEPVRARLAELVPPTCRTLCLDGQAAEIAARPATAPEPVARPEHLAYLIYTSGSTGRPKGVGVPRGAVVHLLGAFTELLDVSPADRWLSVTTPSFDIAVLELLLPLVRGARLVLADRAEVADATALAERLGRDGITVLQATPVTWRLLQLAGGVPSGVRLRVSGGEPIPADLVATLVSDGAHAWNGYGPTETAVYSAVGRVLAPPARIGGPVGDTQLYVVDGRGQLVPPGVVGEVYIGGAGVARGYLGRPDLTAERFLPDPFGGRPGARLYRTGDLARRGADGALDFVGRADQQIKIRGFRVELGEIETQLRRQAGVRGAAVGVSGQGADTALVAYLVPDDPAATVPELWPPLRSRLARHLPEHMIPATAVLLAELPTTPSGKLDRNALPAPDWTAVRAAAPVLPRTATEQALAGIWTDLLGVPTLSVHDNFFALGGHSLTATRLIARIRGTLGAELPLRALFGAPTIAELAEVVEASGPAAAGAGDAIRGDDLPTDLDQLSDAEVDALLARLMSEDEG